MLLTEQNMLILQFVVLIFFFYNIYIFTYLQDFFYTIYNIYTVSVWVLLSSSVVVWGVACVEVVLDNGRGGGGNSMGMATE